MPHLDLKRCTEEGSSRGYIYIFNGNVKKKKHLVAEGLPKQSSE